MGIETGVSAKKEKAVEFSDTAKAVDSGLAEVFSTPSLIALMESAAYTAVQEYLSEGQSTVGTAIKAKHLAATPVGMKVWAKATLKEIEGRRLVFDIEAFDEQEKIGEAEHTRYIIDQEKFMQKTEAKACR